MQSINFEIPSISSRSSAPLKHLSRLVRDKKYRKNEGKMVCEGWKMLEEAQRSHVALQTLLLNADLPWQENPAHVTMVAQAQAQGCRIFQTDGTLFGEASDVETPQGVLFSCASPLMQALPQVQHAIVLDGLQDPGNLGTVLRTADAFALDAVILAEGCVDPTSPKAVRATMGAIFRQCMVQMPLTEAIEALHAQGIAVQAAALEADSQPLSDKLSKTAVVIGNEGNGVSQTALDKADGKVILPMQGSAESLNAGVAAAIFIWEMRKNAGQ